MIALLVITGIAVFKVLFKRRGGTGSQNAEHIREETEGALEAAIEKARKAIRDVDIRIEHDRRNLEQIKRLKDEKKRLERLADLANRDSRK